MEYFKTKSNKLISASIHEIFADKDIEHVLITDKKEHLKQMIKKTIKEGLDKNHQITWNKNSDYEINIFKDREYSDYPEEHAKTITYFTRTVSKNGKIIDTNVITKKNPKYIDNPECEFCYQKTIKLFKAHLLDKNKTEKMVCNKCKKSLKRMAEIMKVGNK